MPEDNTNTPTDDLTQNENESLAAIEFSQQMERRAELDRLRAEYRHKQAQEAKQKAGQEKEASIQNPRMSWGMFLAMGIPSLIADVVEFFTAGTLGWIVGALVDIYLLILGGSSKSGRKQFKKLLVAVIGETIPIIDALPLRTAIVVWSFISSRSATFAKIGKTMNVASKVPSPFSAQLKVASRSMNTVAEVTAGANSVGLNNPNQSRARQLSQLYGRSRAQSAQRAEAGTETPASTSEIPKDIPTA